MRIRSAHENSFVLLAVLALALPTAAAARSAGTGQVLPGPLIAAASVRPELRSEALEFPSLQPLTGLSDPSIAYGLEGIVDWSSGMQFIDIMRMARPWNLEGRYDADGSVPDAYLDEHGWVTRMPPGTSILHRLWSWEGDDPGLAESRAGRYVVRYEGSGSLALGGADVVSQSPGEIIFDTSGTGVVSLFLKSIEPDDPIRDISVVREDLVPLHDAGEIFNPDWIALIEDARQVRYMDFMHTNNSGIRSWDEYPQFGDSHWGRVPVEVMVRLANRIGADPWFSIPFHADDEFARRLAAYVRDNLDPRLVAHVELSNEVWNWAFEQAHDASRLAETAFPDTEGAGWVNYYGKRAAEVMAIWTEVYGPDNMGRLVRVAGVQNGWTDLTNEILMAPMWKKVDPSGYVPPHSFFDAVAATTYFGASLVADPDRLRSLIKALEDPDVDVHEWLHAELQDDVSDTIEFLEEQKDLIEPYGLSLVAYEGGQHVHHSFAVDLPMAEIERLTDVLSGFVRSEQMGILYAELWSRWQRVGDGPFMQFVEVGPASRFGTWGLVQSLGDSNPRSELLEELNARTPAWWEDRGGDHFRHGRIVEGSATDDTLAGTAAEDFLVGGGGADIIYPGPGDDGVNGGRGEDRVLLRGDRVRYSVEPEGDGYRVVGPDGSDYVHAVELLCFEDGTVLDLTGRLVRPASLAPVPEAQALRSGRSMGN